MRNDRARSSWSLAAASFLAWTSRTWRLRAFWTYHRPTPAASVATKTIPRIKAARVLSFQARRLTLGRGWAGDGPLPGLPGVFVVVAKAGISYG